MQELEFEKIVQNFTLRFTIILSRYLHCQCQLPQSLPGPLVKKVALKRIIVYTGYWAAAQ